MSNVTIKLHGREPQDMIEVTGDSAEVLPWLTQHLKAGSESPIAKVAPVGTVMRDPGKEVLAARFKVPAGERTIDHILRAYKELGKPRFSPRELMPHMTRQGWTTKSKDPADVIRTTMRWDKGTFRSCGDGTWEYSGNGKVSVTEGEEVLPVEEPELSLNGR